MRALRLDDALSGFAIGTIVPNDLSVNWQDPTQSQEHIKPDVYHCCLRFPFTHVPRSAFVTVIATLNRCVWITIWSVMPQRHIAYQAPMATGRD